MKGIRERLQNERGFTLVEIIIVLVILAVLMSIMLPSLTGYIDEANDTALKMEARNCYAALQTLASLSKADNSMNTYFSSASKSGQVSGASLTSAGVAKLDGLIAGASSYGSNISNITIEGFAVKSFTYTKDGRTVTFSSDTGYIIS